MGENRPWRAGEMKYFGRVITIVGVVLAVVLIGTGVFWVKGKLAEREILKKVIERLSTDSRAAEVLVTKSIFNEETGAVETTIKFLEYDVQGKPLPARYFTFRGNIIQFQTLVIRFQDKFVMAGDKLRGKSAYLFLKVFMLDGADTQTFDLTQTSGIPTGYHVSSAKNEFEEKLWAEFWKMALDPAQRELAGVKNAQIEAPGSMFLPGTVYKLKIENDGGMRIDAEPLPEIVKGETL
jgi:hypothetical protein